MRALDIDNEIVRLLTLFVTEIKGFGAMARTDLNRVAQDILVPLFTEVYGYRGLRNLDAGTAGNFPAVDLADDEAGVAIQVTATASIEKIKHTLDQFLQDRSQFDPPLREKYPTLIVYILTEKQRSYSREAIDAVTGGRFSFNPTRHIWDFKDVLTAIGALPLERKAAVLELLTAHIGPTLASLATTGLVGVPRGVRTEYFVGREQLLQDIHHVLTGNAGRPSRIAVLTGMGGIGKTQVVLEYLRRYRDAHKQVLWTSASSEVAFLESLAAVTQALLPATKHVQDTDARLAALSGWMNDPANDDWLLVIDSADFRGSWTPARLKALLPANEAKRRLLVTSQYTQFKAFPDARVFNVPPLEEDEARTFLSRLATPGARDDDAARSGRGRQGTRVSAAGPRTSRRVRRRRRTLVRRLRGHAACTRAQHDAFGFRSRRRLSAFGPDRLSIGLRRRS